MLTNAELFFFMWKETWERGREENFMYNFLNPKYRLDFEKQGKDRLGRMHR